MDDQFPHAGSVAPVYPPQARHDVYSLFVQNVHSHKFQRYQQFVPYLQQQKQRSQTNEKHPHTPHTYPPMTTAPCSKMPAVEPLYFSKESRNGSSLAQLPPELLTMCLVDYADWGDLGKTCFALRKSWSTVLLDAGNRTLANLSRS
jgi:hypothetical protein